MNASKQVPRAFQWLRATALLLLIALPVAVIAVRLGAWQAGLLLYAAACLLGALLLAVCVILALLPRNREQRQPLQHGAMLALPGAVLLAVTLAGRGDNPPIHDISTDLEQVPQFTRAPALRGTDANSLASSAETRAQQRQGYPGLGPLLTEVEPSAAWERALATARAMGWEITYEGPRQRRLEAVATTPIMGFKDDIIIRLQAVPEGTRIDLRSVSRVGVSDLGANAARIHAFQQAFQTGR